MKIRELIEKLNKIENKDANIKMLDGEVYVEDIEVQAIRHGESYELV